MTAQDFRTLGEVVVGLDGLERQLVHDLLNFRVHLRNLH